MQHPHDFSVETNTPHLALTDASRCSLLLGTTSQPLSSLGSFICPKTHYSNDYQQTQDTSFLQSIRTQYIDLHLGRSRLWTCLNHQKWKSQAAERKTPPPPQQKKDGKLKKRRSKNVAERTPWRKPWSCELLPSCRSPSWRPGPRDMPSAVTMTGRYTKLEPKFRGWFLEAEQSRSNTIFLISMPT